ncbi:DUF4062 domain-containing protein [Paenibacillus polymyxa]|uniref:DUF4062 domain-containing protein n=1 Tax=Paenibacillus polymyxa TaxID=1406 RepID=UPI0025B6B9CC|nr:DUF4062 domain-containing protein [Paenibacillus polymyxa]MDN4086022.1 DUF4062 domain-containing protein [Paenibacillus polymyxa]MDN4108343.1 DUF4062 domain-containing protein [Paenibacillus polymyxa]
MKKKLQVFISSTYIDMIEERQAAVTAVLNAGHIPAGMELFKSGDQSQKETIKRWIDESDVYMLILGGRYGSIDPKSGKSYTHWEYDYAGEQGKRRFAIVITEEKLVDKAKENPEYMEREHYAKYQDFKREVLGNMSKFYEDTKDIKLVVMESLKDYEADDSLAGWVKSDSVQSMETLLLENTELLRENARLVRENDKLNLKLTQKSDINGLQYADIKSTLNNIIFKLPKEFDDEEAEISLLHFFVAESDSLSVGITNSTRTDDFYIHVYYNIAPKLMQFGLLEKVKVTGVQFEKIQTTKEGFRFLAQYEIEKGAKAKPVKD